MGRERLVAVACGSDAVGSALDILAAARGNKEVVRLVSVEKVGGFGGGGPCDGVETLSHLYDDFHSVFPDQSVGAGLAMFSDVPWTQSGPGTIFPRDRTNGWVMIRAAGEATSAFLRSLQESFSPVAAPGTQLAMKARVFATVTPGPSP